MKFMQETSLSIAHGRCLGTNVTQDLNVKNKAKNAGHALLEGRQAIAENDACMMGQNSATD